ncbi:MAG: hypothetical protein EBS53_09230, partial [Bacteroidetes bacterium]|nr:hypothetical protein [Bacteroidota bacterium]
MAIPFRSLIDWTNRRGCGCLVGYGGGQCSSYGGGRRFHHTMGMDGCWDRTLFGGWTIVWLLPSS